MLTAVGFEALLGFIVNGFEVGCDGKAVACHFHIDITRVLGFEFLEIIPKDIIVLDEFAACKAAELLLRIVLLAHRFVVVGRRLRLVSGRCCREQERRGAIVDDTVAAEISVFLCGESVGDANVRAGVVRDPVGQSLGDGIGGFGSVGADDFARVCYYPVVLFHYFLAERLPNIRLIRICSIYLSQPWRLARRSACVSPSELFQEEGV